MRSRFIQILSVIFIFCSVVQTAHAKDIILWHSMDAQLGSLFQSFVERFNQKPEIREKNIKIVPQFKGNYDQTLEAGLKVLNTKNAPHILQVYEMGNLIMQQKKDAFVPLNKLTETPSKSLQPENFIPTIREFYKSRSQEDKSKNIDAGLPSLPFSASTVILFYNKNAFKNAGLDPENPPKTWEEFEKISEKLKKNGAQKIMASGWLSGHHIDHTAALHNQPIATHGNGIDGNNAVLNINHPFFKYHLSKLAEWHQAGYFSIETGAQAEKAFANGEILILSQGSNRLPILEQVVGSNFEIGLGFFPYWQKKISKPQNTIAGGASFWALSGHSKEDYAAIQAFFEYLASAETQAEWHQKTCYMPVVIGAEQIAENQNFYDSSLKGKAAKIALTSFSANAPREYSRGILLPEFTHVREVMIQEMKEAIRGNKTVENALQQIDVLGNRWMLGTWTWNMRKAPKKG